ncbi:protein FAM13A isoform X2 [Syngnathoides biaculeatus]|uniref:protein FAM13A isoform X2 n=1 Tax=Syngnathoides biaculeatus TaxID=300417 RepID=UPI002ADE5791|nr:protein FAM13A isoform X2 [Syngnathoides biaculeatus]
MGAGALTICHNEAAVQVKEDMKKMVQMPVLRSCSVAAKQTRLFGVALPELQERGLTEDGVPLVVRRMVEYLRNHALQQEGLFRVNGSVRAVEALRQRLESDEAPGIDSDVDTCTVASLLKRYLRDLPQSLVEPAVQKVLVHLYQECGDEVSCSALREHLKQLPGVHLSLLRYLCHFLTLVEGNHKDNRMNAHNLATVFGPSVFHVTPGFEALNEQNICNKILVRFIQNYSSVFEEDTKDREKEDQDDVVLVKVGHNNTAPLCQLRSSTHVRPRKRKVRKAKTEGGAPPEPAFPGHPVTVPLPHDVGALGIPIVVPLRSVSPAEVTKTRHGDPACCHVNLDVSCYGPQDGCYATDAFSEAPSKLGGSEERRNEVRGGQEDERPISPFYMSSHCSPLIRSPDAIKILDRTIRSTVEQHLFDVHHMSDSGEVILQRLVSTARQRRRHRREQQDDCSGYGDKSRTDTNKENIPTLEARSVCGRNLREDTTIVGVDSHGGQSTQVVCLPKSRRGKHNPTLAQLKQDTHRESGAMSATFEGTRSSHMEPYKKRKDASRKDDLPSTSQTLRMKIQESSVVACGGGEVYDPERDKASCEDMPRLDNNWGEPVPAYSALQRESAEREEARLSPHAGGRLIRQLLEEGSDPMLSPRFYAYGQSQQYLDDTEVPPSPPNAHSFVSRRRSSSLGSCDDDKEELTTVQLTKRIHGLKKKIHRFEERFEDERKYRPSHSDKAGNPEVLRWMNELARLRKELKEHKLMKSEEDLPPLTRQRSNTLPKSFGSQLEKKPTQEKVPKPPVESTLEGILKKLQEKRQEVDRPEDIKDMTREQIGAEKLALQKALLYYESIHGRPVTKSERQIMKPLYDRYRLVKQILCRASTIPVIGSPSSKRRGPLLQPIIEGVTALFFDDTKEEEEGSEDDADPKTQFSVTARPDLNVLSFLGHVDEEVDGFISPVDELMPSKNVTDMRLSNLHSASTKELVEQLQEAREEKKRIRKNLKEFEDQFFRQNGRNVQKEDRSPLAAEYNEYKHVKAKLKLLEVLISKRESTKFI